MVEFTNAEEAAVSKVRVGSDDWAYGWWVLEGACAVCIVSWTILLRAVCGGLG